MIYKNFVSALSSATVAAIAFSGQVAQAVVIDGSRAGDSYGPPLAVQAVETLFGDHNDGLGHKGSELDAAYARIANGKLHLMLTGNLEDNFNKLVLFFDSKPGGQNVLDTDTDHFGTNPVVDPSPFPSDPGMFAKMAGGPFFFAPPTTFDAGFEADYAVILRHGFTGAENRFDVDYAVVGGGFGAASQYLNIFDPTATDNGATGIGVNSAPIEVGFDNSNNGGVAFGTDAADGVAAAAVTTGVEIAISLADLGSPGIGDVIKVTAFINGSNHDYVSNQFLAPLSPPQGNLGSDEFGFHFLHETSFNLNGFAGDQYFSYILPALPPGDFNEDGSVDAADYVVWRQGLGITYDEDDYNTWRTHYGQTAGSGASESSRVPEPATPILFLGGVMTGLLSLRPLRRLSP